MAALAIQCVSVQRFNGFSLDVECSLEHLKNDVKWMFILLILHLDFKQHIHDLAECLLTHTSQKELSGGKSAQNHRNQCVSRFSNSHAASLSETGSFVECDKVRRWHLHMFGIPISQNRTVRIVRHLIAHILCLFITFQRTSIHTHPRKRRSSWRIKRIFIWQPPNLFLVNIALQYSYFSLLGEVFSLISESDVSTKTLNIDGLSLWVMEILLTAKKLKFEA